MDSINVFVEQYKRDHPGADVKIIQVPSPDLDTKLRAAVQGGGVPDVIYTFRGYMIGWANAGLTQSVDSIYTKDALSNYNAGAIAAGSYKGHIYYVPSFELPHLLYYRKDWFSQAGLNPPKDWNQVLDDANSLNSPTDRYGFLAYNKPPEEVFAADLMTSFGGRALSKGKAAIDSEETKQALELAIRLFKYAPPGSIAKSQTEARQEFANGLGAMLMASSSTLGAVQEAGIGDKVGVTAVPHLSKGGIPINFYGWAIPKMAANVHGAQDFLRLNLESSLYTKSAAKFVTGFLPVQKSALAQDSAYWSAPAVKVQEQNIRVAASSLSDGVSTVQVLGSSPLYDSIRAAGILNSMVNDVVNGTSPSDAMKKASSAIRDIVSHGS